jgi:hypothetical protein
MAETKTSDQGKVYEGYYALHANDISLHSTAPKGEGAGDGSRVVIDAQGGGSGTKDGHLLLNATGSALLVCDSASVGIKCSQASQEVHIECDATGKISIHQGTPVVSPLIVLKSDGITLSVGPDPAGAKIEMTAEGITLQCGPLSKIQITAQGIKLSVADLNSVELKPSEVDVQGLMVKLNGQIQTDIQGGVQTNVQAGAMLQEKGALTMIG